MKGSENIGMTINIGGELIELNVKFDDQDNVRDIEKDLNVFITKLRKSLSEKEFSNSKIIAMAAYQYANWYHQLLKTQDRASEMAAQKCQEIDEFFSHGLSSSPEDSK